MSLACAGKMKTIGYDKMESIGKLFVLGEHKQQSGNILFVPGYVIFCDIV